MLRNLDLTALRSFLTVVETGGVTRAAGVLPGGAVPHRAQQWNVYGVPLVIYFAQVALPYALMIKD